MITAEVLKPSGDPMVVMLHKIFIVVYATEKTPKDYAQMMVCMTHKKGDKQTHTNKCKMSLLSISGKVSQFGFRPRC